MPKTAPAKRQQLGVVGAELEDHRIVGGDHRQAPGNRKHAERHDKGRKAEIGNEDAIERADHQRRCDGDRNARLDAVSRVHRDREHHAAQAEHRAYREVDATGDDDERHAQRDDCDESDVAGDVVKVLRRRKTVGGEGQEDTSEDDCNQNPEGLAGQDRSCKRALPVGDRLVQRRCHLSLEFLRHGRSSSLLLIRPRWRR